MSKIDDIDKKISDLLIEDGRMTCVEIARRIGNITERAVRYRIDRLIKRGIIDIRGNVNAKNLGFNVFADVFIEVEPGLVIEVARKIAEFECVSYVACATGERDISVQIFAKDNTELYTFVTDVISRISGVRRTHTSFVPVIIKDDHCWPIPSICVKKNP
jgi:Lrp/AsnC family transcriptional regulator for asnA, asnC and gidA